jgi:signal transduction histidine kinase
MAEAAPSGLDPIVACFRRCCGGAQLSCDPRAVPSDFISSFLESDPSAVVALDCAFDVVAANSRARLLLGMDGQSLPVRAGRFIAGDILDRIESIFAGPGQTQTASFRARLAGAKGQLHVKASRLRDASGRTLGVALAFSGTLWDHCPAPANCVPERVEALGLYAAGMVHEFNNMLSVISGRAGLGLMAHGPAAKNRALENVITAARRAEHITRNLLTYVHRQRPEFVLVDLARPVLDAVALLEVELTASHVEIVRNLDALPAVLCDPVQVSQVCFNLLRNAKDAMPEGGAVVVRLARHGNWAVLSVADNGRGIPPEIRARLFEPFVSHGRSNSLKPSGTGLGLFIAREIVLAHGGEISVESVVARGSTFTVRLPIARQV